MMFLVFLIFCVGFSQAQVSPNKLCLSNYNHDACQQISRDQDMNCHYAAAKTDCIIDAANGLPTLTVLEAEEAFLGAGLVSDQAVVIGEIVSENTPYQTAVIVRQSYNSGGGFEALRGLKYCHPGYLHDEKITNYVLDQLDWKAVNLSCNSSKTLTEQKYEALSVTFASSCRPGKWTEDAELDARLKNEYSQQCELCGTDGCNTRYNTPLNDTLNCLTQQGGDVALTSLKYAQQFFSDTNNSQNFQYLCPDGSLSSAVLGNPCTWTRQLNRVILTSSQSSNVMRNYISTKLSSYLNSTDGTSSPSSIEQHLALLLQMTRTDKINLFDAVPLRNFVSERRTIPTVNNSIQCGLSLNWSVTDNKEFEKCSWLQQASLTTGLQPVVSCVLSNDNDTVSNLENIKKGTADVAFADANFGYISRRKNLSNVAFPETDTRQLSKIVILVKNDTTWYTKLDDLKGKGVCLPEYGGKEWLALIDLLRIRSVIPDSCDYGKLLSDFVGDSCAPGANAKDLDIPDTNSDKFCSKCYSTDVQQTHAYCNADSLNKYYDSLGALTCLEDGSGDYAVVALNDLPMTYQKDLEAHQQFKVISKNGSLAGYNGFEIDENSPLTLIVAGEVIVKNGTSKYNDTMLYLREIEVKFGQDLEKSFKLFDSFNNTHNLLFPDSTPGLTFQESTNVYIENFRSLLQRSETCSRIATSGSYRVIPVISTFIILSALSLVF